MAGQADLQLARRERQIMDVVYRLGRATVADVLKHLTDPPSYSAVRAMLRLLEEKGHLKHTAEGTRYVYHPTQSREKVRCGALSHLVKTFFNDSVESAVVALLNLSDHKLSGEELDRLSRLIDEARARGQQ
jgi:predicted transcriptional regulator